MRHKLIKARHVAQEHPGPDTDQRPLGSGTLTGDETAPEDLPWRERLVHRMVDIVAKAIINAVLRLPYERRVPMMGWIIAHVIGRIAPYHARAKANLALIYPDMPQAERARLATACLNNMGRALIESYSTNDLLDQMKDTPFEGPGFAALQQAIADKRPVILQTGHFGNYEAARAAMYGKGLAPGGIFREMSNPYFHKHYVQTLLAYGGPGFLRGPKGTRGMVKHLRAGGQLIILNDQHVFGAPVLNFLGRPAHCALSPAELALRFDALVLPYFAIRNPDGLSFRCIMEAPIPLTDPETMTQEMNDRLGQHIRAHPEQWFWVHRRWRASALKTKH